MSTQDNHETPSIPVGMVKLSAAQEEQQPRKIGCLAYLWGGGAVLLILFWFNVMRSVPPRVAPEITHITEPRTPDGRFVDYMAAIEAMVYPPEMATDENGYRMVMRAIGPMEKSLLPEHTQRRYEKLGLDFILDKPTLAFADQYTFFDSRYKYRPEDFDEILANMKKIRGEPEPDVNEEVVGYGGQRTIEEEVNNNPSLLWEFAAQYPEMHKLPIVREWFEANNAALDLIVEATKKPVFVTPTVIPRGATCLYFAPLPDIQGIRSFACGLEARATIRVAEGDIDGAIEDILACYRLGRHLIRPGRFFQQIVGIACEGIAHSLAYNGNLLTQANAEQLRHLMEGLNDLPQRGTWEDGIEMERLATLDVLTAIMNDPASL
ncbi:MAG: hypothetical protein FWH27_13930, partial [Planctomycetaceae bacterium]|nr:hypothetical protein [Planctomycetaceae bacterium]